MQLITPEWPSSPKVHCLISSRLGGVSQAPYDSLNLGSHVGDIPERVAKNRSLISLQIPSDPIWLQQIHSALVSTPAQRKKLGSEPIIADAAITEVPNEVLAILTADCLPVLFAANDGSIIGAAHAGWKGLCAGILENTVSAMLHARPQLKSFASSSVGIKEGDFQEIPHKKGKYLANLYSLAKSRLNVLGINHIDGGQMCTFQEPELFYSYRRDGVTGRFASLIWIA